MTRIHQLLYDRSVACFFNSVMSKIDQLLYDRSVVCIFIQLWVKSIICAYFHSVVTKIDQLSNNYRPVSLTVALCKVIEHVIYRSIMQHLEHNNILYFKQTGFRKNHSCDTQLLLTIEDLAKNLDEGSEIDLQIFDFSKAFDKVPHQRLLSKLNHCEIQGKTLA